jgi:GAF domain-containing protein
MRQPYIIADAHATEHWTLIPASEWIRSSIGVPIERGGAVIGALIVDSATPNRFAQADIEKLQAFGRYASLALESAYHVTHLEQGVAARTAQLNAANEQLTAILNHSLDSILLVEPDLRIAQTNTGFARR